MCSFCKSCIYKYFLQDARRERCPSCKNAEGLGGKPLKNVVPDATLQAIVDLMYPQFKQQDLATIKDLYTRYAEAGEPLPKDTELIEYGFNYEAFSQNTTGN